MSSRLQEATSLVERLEAIVNNPRTILDLENDGIRRRFREAGRKLSIAMETAGDTTHRIANTPLQVATARIGVEKGIFESLVDASKEGATLSNAELAGKTEIDPTLLKRLLRYYQSHDMIAQPADDAYGANNVTQALTTLCGRSGTSYFFEMISQSFMALPQFLRDTRFRDPTDPARCPWHLGHRTELGPFPWLQANPRYMDFFLPWMAANREGLPIFLDALDDFRGEFLGPPTATGPEGAGPPVPVRVPVPIFVDVGGAMGHQCVALRERYPDLEGRVILQDQDFVVEQVRASPLPGLRDVEVMVHDIFTPQPVKGARAYYLRNVLHDWPDGKCKQILQNIKSAMTEDSVILLDEMVLSERGAPWRATQLDMAMLTCLAAKERTRSEWRSLLEESGLAIRRIWKYTEECEDCIIVAVPLE